MSDLPIVTATETDPTVETLAYECKFTVESRGGIGGDWERNIGGTQQERRVTFSGYASTELYDALISAITKVVES